MLNDLSQTKPPSQNGGFLSLIFCRDFCKNRGFTLIELAVVITVLGIVLAIGVPRLLERSDFDAMAFRHELRSAVAHAQRVAIASRRFVCIETTASMVSFTQIDIPPENTGASLTCTTPLNLPKGRPSCAGNPDHQICPPGNVQMSNVVFIFDAAGRPIASNKQVFTTPIHIGITDQDDLIIEAESGHVH